jgi:hypothetical protein
MRPSSIIVHESCSCAGGRGDSLTKFLQRRYSAADVRLVEDGFDGLVVDGKILAEGGLPNFIDAVTVVETGEPLSPTSCCNPDGSCG